MKPSVPPRPAPTPMNSPDRFDTTPLDLLRAELGRVGDEPQPATPTPPAVQINISGGQQGNVIGHIDTLTIHQSFVPPPDK